MLDLKTNLVNWLNNEFNPFETLEEMGVKVTGNDRYPNLYNLKYGSVTADKSDPIVCACRGAVVERVDDGGDHSPYYRLVAYAFDRFFNIGESNCHVLHWPTTKVMEKMDGSLIKCFHYEGNWLVSTSGSVAGDSQVGDTGRTFVELFWDVFEEVGYSRDWLQPHLCYVFELCHKDNKVVVDYFKPQLPLLTVRDRKSNFIELPLDTFSEKFGFTTPTSYSLGNLEDVLRFVNNRGGGHEGVILFDGVGRAKSKSDLYCQLHSAVNNGKPNFSELFLQDNLDEFLLHFPEFSPEFLNYVGQIKDMGEQAERFVIENVALPQKEFAQKLMSALPEISGAVFSIRSGKYKDFGHFVENMTSKQLDRLLGL